MHVYHSLTATLGTFFCVLVKEPSQINCGVKNSGLKLNIHRQKEIVAADLSPIPSLPQKLHNQGQSYAQGIYGSCPEPQVGGPHCLCSQLSQSLEAKRAAQGGGVWPPGQAQSCQNGKEVPGQLAFSLPPSFVEAAPPPVILGFHP